MPVIFGGLISFPPLVMLPIPERSKADAAPAIDGMNAFAERLAELKPDVLVLVTTEGHEDEPLRIVECARFIGTLKEFGHPEKQVMFPFANRYAAALGEEVLVQGIPVVYEPLAGDISERFSFLVPLFYSSEAGFKGEVVPLQSHADDRVLARIGGAIARVAEEQKVRVAVVMMTDLVRHGRVESRLAEGLSEGTDIGLLDALFPPESSRRQVLALARSGGKAGLVHAVALFEPLNV